jgi:citrate synthase
MAEGKVAQKGGLEGVVAADSAIGWIDGSVGELRYCGYLIKELAEHSSFAETCCLLWDGELPSRARLAEVETAMRAERALPQTVLGPLRSIARESEPMDALRTAASLCQVDDIAGDPLDPALNLRRAMRLTARFATIVAAHHRLRRGLEPIAPRTDLTHAANFLYMLTGDVPAPEVEKIFDVCLVLHAEHGFNASTFAARVTAATLSDMYSAITSAVGTLKGPLHGGANTEVMLMLEEIGSLDAVDAWLEDKLGRGEKIMGFGHRVYKVVDPRALILQDFSKRLAELQGDDRWFAMSERMAATIKKRKKLDVNVDFYSASVYRYLGIEADLYTAIFAISRVSGWTAHVLEQYANNRLIRPQCNWVGSPPRDYVPIEQRS